MFVKSLRKRVIAEILSGSFVAIVSKVFKPLENLIQKQVSVLV